MIHQLNTQEDYGPLEHLNNYIATCANPKEAIINIGATRYMGFRKNIFLKKGDDIIVTLYPKDNITKQELLQNIENHTNKNINILSQRVIKL